MYNQLAAKQEGHLEQMRIDLAHEPDFVIASLAVHPSTRELSRDRERLVIEPRVMQVLVALHRAGGAVVSKDDLAQSCWEGRVVGEDAINRVLSRLRKVSETIGKDIFRIETVTRVGYRLIPDGKQTMPLLVMKNGVVGRRAVLIGGGVLALTGAAAFWLGRGETDQADDLPAKSRELARRGREAMLYGTPEQVEEAIALFRQATAATSDSTYLWGALALAYSQQAMQSRQQDFERLITLADSAAERALAIDPDNPEAKVVRIFGAKTRGDRVHMARQLSALVKRHPDNGTANRVYAFHLSHTGRNSEALPHLERAMAIEPYAPPDAYAKGAMLWSLNRLDEATLAYDRGFSQWPRHYGVWFSRYKYLAYTGRVSEARAMMLDVGKRPTGIPEENFEINDTELIALTTRHPADIARAIEVHMNAARTGVGFAINAMLFAAVTDNPDLLFEIADAIYFDRGFQLGQQRYTREQGLYSPTKRRPTHFLFERPLAPYWRDPRFDTLVDRLGLKEYWRMTGSTPDYLRAA